MRGKNVVFHTEKPKGKFANGIPLGKQYTILSNGRESSIFPVEKVLFVNTVDVDLSVKRMADLAGIEDPYPEPEPPKLTASDVFRVTSPHLLSAHIPELPQPVSFALRRFGAGTFANIWLDIKERAQNGIYCK